MASAAVVRAGRSNFTGRFAPGRQNAFQAKAQRDHVALLRLLNDLADDFLGLAVEQCFGQHRGLVARAFGPARGIAALAGLEGATTLLLRCIINVGRSAVGGP
jgi:hypothetical protein